MDTPILDMLKGYYKKQRISFCMPGHKNGSGLCADFSSFSLDTTELADTDNLQNPTGAVLLAKKKAAEFYKSDETFFLVNGSTGGIHTMLKSVCDFGDTVLVSRAIHVSVINACILFGINPVFIEQEIIPEFNIPGDINPENLKSLIKKYKPKAVFVTSPNYFGVSLNVSEISKITHSFDIPLLVDEAHGAHFCADKNLFPEPAIVAGADMVVQSAHKTLNAPNQTAFLHLKSDKIDAHKVQTVLNMLQTSSPSYLMCAALDYARYELSSSGKEMWQDAIKNAKDLKKKISPYYKVLKDVQNADCTRIVINLSGYRCTGYELSDILRLRYNIDIEMADAKNLVLIATSANKKSDFEAVGNALVAEAKKLTPCIDNTLIPTLPKIDMVMSPNDAFRAKHTAYDIMNSAGKICSKTLFSYPPAMPITVPGARITGEVIEYILKVQQMGAQLTGLLQGGQIEIVEEN